MKREQLFSRRMVLRGLGATLALPFLETLGGKTLAAGMKGKDPSRFACFYIPGAISQYNWFPKDAGPKYTLAPTHQPLAHHRDRFSVLTGLSRPTRATLSPLQRPVLIGPNGLPEAIAMAFQVAEAGRHSV